MRDASTVIDAAYVSVEPEGGKQAAGGTIESTKINRRRMI